MGAQENCQALHGICCAFVKHPMIHSVAFTSETQRQLCDHLLREAGQEDLCFAIWYPSAGETRMSALIKYPVMPLEDERLLHGNASVTPEYFERALGEAIDTGGGIAFMHSHLGPGWQGMSGDDIRTEQAMAAQAKAVTGLPLVGMTAGTDVRSELHSCTVTSVPGGKA